ncbi:hypothetical protein P7C70_g1704, partial [Phenoliferia sp. Uapishka_3]
MVFHDKRDKYLIAHGSTHPFSAVIGTTGVLFFIPAAILVARYLRRHTWFPIHAALNALGAACIVVAFGIGYYETGSPHFQDTHTKVGLALLILVLVQVVLGSVAKATKSDPNNHSRLPTLSRKSPIRLVHIVVGLATLGLGLAQPWLGFHEYPGNSDGGQSVARGVFIVYYILIALIAFLYLMGWVKEAMGRNRNKEGHMGGDRDREHVQAEKLHSRASPNAENCVSEHTDLHHAGGVAPPINNY